MKKLRNRKTGDKGERSMWLVGIDEVGRGPLAGPVTVGAVAVEIDGRIALTYKNLRKKLMEISGKKYPIGVDSKKMKESERDFWYEVILKLVKGGELISVVSSSSAQMIDKRGIAVCIKNLVDTNLKKISNKFKIKLSNSFAQMNVLLDGGLKTSVPVASQKTIIKGDEKELLISLASVYAKVTRDIYMKKLSKNSKYSTYGFDIHKGYGTLKHRQTILKHGLSDEHRRTFCKNIF
ncbi:MAG: ribonuclease HII [Candidatus Pacebacteria bacterium]|nr:ribonuclease HII [Candidatus Paceibacterota bacterium]MBP9818906.1 ribonuclease HII [Candidatus Paceibacterota bacterium]